MCLSGLGGECFEEACALGLGQFVDPCREFVGQPDGSLASPSLRRESACSCARCFGHADNDTADSQSLLESFGTIEHMAMHRRPTRDDGPPPVELLRFRPDNWPGSPDETTWYPAYQRWCGARSAWEDRHPGRLGGLTERLQDEHETRHRLMQAWPLEPMGRVDIHNHVIREGVYDPVTSLLRGRVSGEEDIPAGGIGIRHCDWLPGI